MPSEGQSIGIPPLPPASIDIPSAYVDGHGVALETHGARAVDYLAHTCIGDPLADALMNDLSSMEGTEVEALLDAAINDRDTRARADFPQSLLALIQQSETVPEWVDLDAFWPAYRLFHRDSYLAVAALTGGTLVEGFSTTIAKSFFITGRVRDQGVRRLQQNNRHMIEILLPGGLGIRGDGWKLSVRLRFVHARIRHLLAGSQEWDHIAWGTPLSAAHMGFAVTAFSARMLQHMKKLGSRYSVEERDSFMAVWRYTGYIMGIPQTILFEDYDDALELFNSAVVCEPPPSVESAVMAHSLINSAPIVAGEAEPAKRQKFANQVFLISRALIGDSLANSLNYPKGRAIGVTLLFRMLRRIQRRFPKLFSSFANSGYWSFSALLEVSALNEIDITYRLPDHVRAEESSEW